MAEHRPPQPHPDRLTPFVAHPVVVGVVPEQPPLVALTAAALATANGQPLHAAYVDPSRYVEREHPDGAVEHAPIDPDSPGEDWLDTRDRLAEQLGRILDEQPVPWRLHYLAGRTDRALTHLARAVDAAAIVVGSHVPRHAHTEFLHRSVGAQLTHRQHRPVLIVPLEVVDWKASAPWE